MHSQAAAPCFHGLTLISRLNLYSWISSGKVTTQLRLWLRIMAVSVYFHDANLPPLPFLPPVWRCVFMPAACVVCCADCRGKEKGCDREEQRRLRITHVLIYTDLKCNIEDYTVYSINMPCYLFLGTCCNTSNLDLERVNLFFRKLHNLNDQNLVFHSLVIHAILI